jgi:hypothetical protein
VAAVVRLALVLTSEVDACRLLVWVVELEVLGPELGAATSPGRSMPL